MRTSSGEEDLLDRPLAARAWFALAAIDLELGDVVPPLAIEVHIHVRGGPPDRQRSTEALLHAVMQLPQFLPRERARPALRPDAGAPKGFVSVNIADAGDASLLHEQRLDLLVR